MRESRAELRVKVARSQTTYNRSSEVGVGDSHHDSGPSKLNCELAGTADGQVGGLLTRHGVS